MEETDPYEKYYLEIDISMLESNLGLVYKFQNQNQKAINITKKAELIFKKLGLDFYLIQSYTTLSELYYIQNNLILAKKYGELSLELVENENYIEIKSNSYLILSKVYEKLENHDLALTYKVNSQILYDSFFRIDNKQALAEAEIKYKYDKKAFSDSLVNIQKQHSLHN